MVDYAHNAAGFRAIGKFLERVDAYPKVGIIAGVGDRRNEDILLLGREAARIFDEIIIRQDKNLRGRSESEIIDLLTQGIRQEAAHKEPTVIPNEAEAIRHALANAKEGAFIIICSDVVPDALELVMKFKEEEEEFSIERKDIPNIEHSEQQKV